jgi:hypothetical protein
MMNLSRISYWRHVVGRISYFAIGETPVQLLCELRNLARALGIVNGGLLQYS